SKIVPVAAERPLFPPLDQALIQAMACEVVAQTKEPLSRQSLADLVRRAQTASGKKISRTTVWRMLHEAAIKPWQYEHWIFPRDPRFAEKAGPILDLYAGKWEGKQLAYVWGGRDLRAVAPRSDSANFPGFFSILCSVFRDSVVTILRVISWNSPDF